MHTLNIFINTIRSCFLEKPFMFILQKKISSLSASTFKSVKTHQNKVGRFQKNLDFLLLWHYIHEGFISLACYLRKHRSCTIFQGKKNTIGKLIFIFICQKVKHPNPKFIFLSTSSNLKSNSQLHSREKKSIEGGHFDSFYPFFQKNMDGNHDCSFESLLLKNDRNKYCGDYIKFLFLIWKIKRKKSFLFFSFHQFECTCIKMSS